MKVYIDDLIGADGEVKGKIFIESDSMQYQVVLYRTTEKGTEWEDKQGYYQTLTSAMRAVIRMKVHESTATTLNELVTEIKRIEESIQSKLEVVEDGLQIPQHGRASKAKRQARSN